MLSSGEAHALWKSDGTEAGTVLVSDSTSFISRGPVIGDTLFFVAKDAAHGAELWKSDAQGTALVKDINAGSSSSNPANIVAIGAQIYFAADDGVHGIEPWRSDGTSEGTVLVKDVGATGGDMGVVKMIPVEHQAYLKVIDSQDKMQPGDDAGSLWRTNGTPEGTIKLRDIDLASSLAVLGDELYFSYSYGRDPAENGLWKTDGTIEGTRQVIGAVKPWKIVVAGRRIFFQDEALQLWVSDSESNRTERIPIPYEDPHCRYISDIVPECNFPVHPCPPRTDVSSGRSRWTGASLPRLAVGHRGGVVDDPGFQLIQPDPDAVAFLPQATPPTKPI